MTELSRLAAPRPRVYVFPDIPAYALAVRRDPHRGGALIGMSRELFYRLDRHIWQERGESLDEFVDIEYVRGQSLTLPFAEPLAIEMREDAFEMPAVRTIEIVPRPVEVVA